MNNNRQFQRMLRSAGPELAAFGFTARTMTAALCLTLFAAAPLCGADTVATPPEVVLAAESDRVKLIERIAPSVVCIYDAHRRGGGSGVLIDADGYGLTNYHVVASMLKSRKGFGGLADGVLYDLEVLGIDITGDVAMFRLQPPKPEFRFPHVTLGDSDSVRVGDTAIAIGNPFSLSEDYSPSVSLGIVTGVHRYQWGVRGNLVYTDCIQVDAAINPGNSGGPLFNGTGEVIGINGRISVNTRGRFNVGFGYAISANQIKRFMPALRAGNLARHGTWQAVVEDDLSSGLTAYRGARARFAEVKPDGPAHRAGIRADDTLVSFDGIRIRTANQVASLLGTYPSGWPVVLGVQRHEKYHEVVIRLDPVEPSMRGTFEVDRDINLRAARRVIESFQRAVLGKDDGKLPTGWRWTADRTYHPNAQGNVRPAERFQVSQGHGELGRMLQRHSDGSSGRIIRYDDNHASQQITENEPPYNVPPAETAVLAAKYIVHGALLRPAADLDLAHVVHGGGDALIESIELRAGNPPDKDADRRINPKLLEVLHWFMPGGAEAKLAFDAETGLLMRITVIDEISGVEATVLLSDYRDIGGLRWPCAWEVKAAGLEYCETLSDWEVAR